MNVQRKEFFRPNPVTTTTLRPNSNVSLPVVYNARGIQRNTKTKRNDGNQIIHSLVSNRPNGYYESEWCNIFYRCVAMEKRVDERCPIAGICSVIDKLMISGGDIKNSTL